AAGQVTDIGISDVFATTCFMLPQGLPAGVNDAFGPIQAMTLVAPASSTEKSISADAAYFVYGFGSQSGVNPWTDENFIFQRNAGSGTQNIIAATIGVPADKFKGKPNSGSDTMLNSLIAAGQTSSAQGSIGMLAADFADTNRSQLNVLAFE